MNAAEVAGLLQDRWLMLGALAEGMTPISGFLEGEDALATLAAFRRMGVEIEGPQAGLVRIRIASRSGLAHAGEGAGAGVGVGAGAAALA